jgi:hypothetical protein
VISAPVRSSELPAQALLEVYQRPGHYVDCYVCAVARAVTLADFVTAFYTSAVFWPERVLLHALLARPSTKQQIEQFARAESNVLAAWTVEARASDQVLLADMLGRTKSWLMVAATGSTASPRTQLYFGSAVVPARRAGADHATLSPVVGALLPLHKLYSRALLHAACRGLSR